MARKPTSQIEYMQNKLAQVTHDRARSVTPADIAHIRADLGSPSEQVRASALREICPCRLRWDSFEQLRKPALNLRRDPSPTVRALAEHIEEDTREIRALEALQERELDREDAGAGYGNDRRRRQRNR